MLLLFVFIFLSVITLRVSCIIRVGPVHMTDMTTGVWGRPLFLCSGSNTSSAAVGGLHDKAVLLTDFMIALMLLDSRRQAELRCISVLIDDLILSLDVIWKSERGYGFYDHEVRKITGAM